MSKNYVSLHNHSTFSILDSLIKPSEVFKRVKELGQSAIAITDTSTLAGAHDCLKYSKEAGVKLLMGCNFSFVDDIADTKKRLRNIILIAKNQKGYKNLLLALKLANDNNIVAFKRTVPRIDWKILEQVQDGLICTTSCGNGILGQLINNKKADEAKIVAKRLKGIFGESLALEIQPHNLRRNANAYNDYEDQMVVNNTLIKFGQELDIKVVAATNAHYLYPEQGESHDVLLAIGAGQPVRSGARLKYLSENCKNQFYVKSRDEVLNFFARWYKDKAEVFCDNSLFFADMCEDPDWIDPKFSNPTGKELPEFPVKDQPDYIEFKNWIKIQSEEVKSKSEDAQYLRFLCDRKFSLMVPAGKELEYRARIEEEFEVLEYHGFCSYMLIVADYIEWARKNGILLGPGRGSVGGCLIAYLTGIHKADPIRYGLIFARFHNKEKSSFPDIDLDFSPTGREKVHEYLRKKYGEDKIAHVSNVNTMTPKVYVRDISRTFEFGGDRKMAVIIGNNIADSIPTEIKTMGEAFEKAGLFDEHASKHPELRKYALDLAGKAKAYSTHAGGIVIGRRPLAEIVPLRRDKEGAIAIEYDKERAEANGLVKMDTLGLETLDIIKTAYDLIVSLGKPAPPNPPNYEEYDAHTYDLISRGDTLCVFQLGGSAGTIDLCRKVKPKSIEDISIINSLARPAAKDIRADFIATKNNLKKIELLHPYLQRAFGETLGFGLFEESLMYLAQDIAGWNLHSADRLRKLTKDKGKNPKKVAGWKKEFIEDAVEKKHVPKDIATKIWEDVVENFGGYGFNKSHSILYSLISYHTAYLKAHYPLEFLVANLMSEVNSNAKVAEDNIIRIKDEIRKYNINILPPDINKSQLTYKIIDDKILLTGLDSLKYMGKDAIPEILKNRPFTSFEDFLSKIDGKKVRAPAVMALAASGCLDSFGMTRKQMYLYASDYKKKLQLYLKKGKKGEFKYPWPDDKTDWTLSEKFAMETYYIGEGLSGNIREAYPGFFSKNSINFNNLIKDYPEPATKSDDFISFPITHDKGTLEFIVKSIFEFKVKKETSKIFGQDMARIIIQDCYGNSLAMTFFPKSLTHFKKRLKELGTGKTKLEVGMGLRCRGAVNWFDGDISILFEDLQGYAPPPLKPKDLEPKKVSMRIVGKAKKEQIEEIDDPEDILEEIEEELIEEGLSDIDEFIDEDDEKKPEAFV